MMETLYIEEAVWNHPRTREILKRFPKAVTVPCSRYGEVFNPKAQNFRLQKERPALILAGKFDHFILEAPEGYGIGGGRNFYFSHMLNCIYDCRYCFLQGMYRSAHYVLFVNYEDFQSAIERKIKEAPDEESYFFSGYDCDSLALESVTHFAEEFLPHFARYPKAWLELRTKSVQINSLLEMDPVSNCVVAFSLSPETIVKALEAKTPSLELRLKAMEQLGRAGWKLGLRFDPLIYHDDYETQYQKLFKDVFRRIDVGHIHSVSFGSFRLPKGIYENMFRLYPDEKLLAGTLTVRDGMITYPEPVEAKMFEFIRNELAGYVPDKLLFPCLV
jgi:spore photoproduct lyase